MINNFETTKIIENALKEDIGFGDITTDNIIDEFAFTEANMVAKKKVS